MLQLKPAPFGEVLLTVEAAGYQPFTLSKLKLKGCEENTYEVRLQLLAQLQRI